jgi:hypothetical protein
MRDTKNILLLLFSFVRWFVFFC